MILVEESVITKKLENVDRELHSIISELKAGKEKSKMAAKKPEKPSMSLKDLREAFGKSVKSDIDPTKLIRKMRDRKYDL